MLRRDFLRSAGAATALAAGGQSLGISQALAQPGDRLRDLPELRSGSGGIKTQLIMENGRFQVGERVLTMPAYRFAHMDTGSLPGPTLRVRPGDRVEWDLVNRMRPTGYPDGATDAQKAMFDQLEYTNVHVHGLQVSPKPGHDNVYQVLRPFCTPEPYTYDIPGPDTGRAQPSGMFWYHPHKHGSTTHQAWQGLSGAIIVEGEIDEVPEIRDIRERVIVLNGLLVNPAGEVPRAAIVPNAGFSPFTPIPSQPTDILLTMNGQLRPVIDIQPGEVQRWRFLNAAPHRFFWLDLEGHEFYQIGQDGIPFAAPRPVKRLLMAPGNRAEFLVKGGAPGTYRLHAELYEQGHPGGARPGWVIGTVEVAGPTRDDPIPSRLVEPPRMPDLPIAKRRTIHFKGEISGNEKAGEYVGSHDHSPGPRPPVQFYLDGKVFALNRIDQKVLGGTVEEWTLVNEDVFQHPFHIHVNPFQVVAVNGQPTCDDTWWDVIALPSRGQLTVRMYFRPDIDGKTVYHCHILPHEDNGMMANLYIYPPGTDMENPPEIPDTPEPIGWVPCAS
ncbi:multicopper oxidase family protein [Roseovarius aestuariivivens]|uniref:multicopper oxidase family protein n=1 Tax=Roseovarius aestuariivivens TaxID=1888910 RepID=UPI001AEBF5B4|nr:multicopper oxidase family protein [Roseovarius aestuariivivens]